MRLRILSDHANRRDQIFYALLALMSGLYVLLSAYTPVSIYSDSALDDELYLVNAQYLAAGNWLGTFDYRTLAKGHGYPMFLAISAWTGLPITISQAIFTCLAAAAMALVVKRLSGSRLLAFAIALLVLEPRTGSTWNQPRGDLPCANRFVHRDSDPFPVFCRRMENGRDVGSDCRPGSRLVVADPRRRSVDHSGGGDAAFERRSLYLVASTEPAPSGHCGALDAMLLRIDDSDFSLHQFHRIWELRRRRFQGTQFCRRVPGAAERQGRKTHSLPPGFKAGAIKDL